MKRRHIKLRIDRLEQPFTIRRLRRAMSFCSLCRFLALRVSLVTYCLRFLRVVFAELIYTSLNGISLLCRPVSFLGTKSSGE